jgi:hypothetical protein
MTPFEASIAMHLTCQHDHLHCSSQSGLHMCKKTKTPSILGHGKLGDHERHGKAGWQPAGRKGRHKLALAS